MCYVVIIEPCESFQLENYVRVVALASDLRKVSFYSVTEFLHYNFIIKLFLLLILIKESCSSFKTH